MVRNATRTLVGFGFAALAVVVSVSMASAFSLRAPQVTINGGGLQGYLNGVGESINTATDQVNAQVWSSSASGNAVFTLMLELAGFAPNNALGVYNADDALPALRELFPGAASPGWFAVASFQASGNLVVNLFDPAAGLISTNTYTNVHRNKFGFYLQGPEGTFYSEDGRNAGGAAQILTYAGTGSNFGEWWMAFEDLPSGAGDNDFDDAVIILESVVPVPAHATTWGAVKGLYR